MIFMMIGREPIKKISQRALDENQLKKSQSSFPLQSKVMLLRNRETENSHQKISNPPFILRGNIISLRIALELREQ